MEGCTNIVELFLSRGVDVDDPDKESRTSLYYAAWKGRLDTVEFLVDKGANIHAGNIYGTKPIHVATDGHQEIVEFLLSNGANIHDTNKEGGTPLYFAAGDGNLDIVKFLVDKGADINAKDDYGKTPLGCAREERHRKIVGYLVFSAASMFREQGKYNKAWQAYQEAFDIQKRRDVLGPDHPDILSTRHNMAVVLDYQGKYSEALEIYQAVFEKREEILGPDHPDTLMTRGNMAGVLCNQGNYSKALRILREVLNIKKAKLGSDHPSTLLSNRHIEIVSREQASRRSIQFHQKQEEAYFHLSEFVSNNFQNASIEPVRQGLYLSSFEVRSVKIDGKCVAITRGLSQALLSQGGKPFLSNLETSSKVYERIAQGKQVSKREEREVFAFSKLLDDFERQLDSTTNSLPSSLIHTKGYKTLGDLSSYIAGIKGDFAIHLITSNHVIAIYRIGDNYAYFDSNIAFVCGLKMLISLWMLWKKECNLLAIK